MNDVVSLALIVSSLIIVIGFLCNYLFERTGFPDMLFLILLGILFGPILRLLEPLSLVNLAPYLAALALVFILFDGGMRMNIYQVLSESPRAALLAVLGFSLSVAAITLFMKFLLEVPLLYAILFGSIYGGSSSIAVVSLAAKIKISEKCSTILSLESAITDILCIVVSLAVIGIILTGQADYMAIGKEIASKFSTGAIVGVLFGILWLTILRKVAKVPYAYMLTLGVVLMAYSTSEYLGGSGALCSLLFGMVLGNEKDIYRMLRREKKSDIAVDAGLKRFESEIAFLIRSFFFVYLGLIATITDVRFLIQGFILSLMLLLVRFGAVAIATIHSELREERPIMSVMLTRGLAAAVLATLPMQYTDTHKYGSPAETFASLSSVYINLAVVIIIFTAIICTVGILLPTRRKRKLR